MYDRQCMEDVGDGRRNGSGGLGMRGVQFAVHDLVANGRPTDLAAELDHQVVFFKQSKFVRHDNRRTVVELHETKAQRLGAAARVVFRRQSFSHFCPTF